MTSPLNWQDFLKQTELPENADCLSFTNTEHALVRVTGGDAESFLHAQLSNSVTGMPAGEVRFAAWCNAKGRVWTLVRYWKDADAFILRMPADQVEDSVKRLRMFVLRSDVQLESLDWHCIQFLGPDAESQAQLLDGQQDQSYRISLPLAWPTYEVWSPERLHSDLPQFPESLIALPRILAGQPEVFADQREEWIPQMLNLDKLDGIDFNKGCYPGQEIVAKLHYKGGLKQRMFVASTPKTIASTVSGAPITDQTGKNVGQILEAAALQEEYRATAIVRTEVSESPLEVEGQALKLAPG